MLGDFIAATPLKLRAEEHNGPYSYFIQSFHGSSPIFSQPTTPESHLSGVVLGVGDVQQPGRASNVFLQSKARERLRLP